MCRLFVSDLYSRIEDDCGRCGKIALEQLAFLFFCNDFFVFLCELFYLCINCK